MEPVSSYVPAAVLVLLLSLSLSSIFCCRGRAWGSFLALGFAAAFAAAATMLPTVIDGGTVEASYPWVPYLGLRLTLAVDGLSLLFALMILGIGAVIMAYSARYLKSDSRPASFYALLCLFAASMYGLVVASDIILIFCFWELTSVTSFLLIGSGSPRADRPATIAFLVTAAGGLALLAALVLAGVTVGSWDIREIIAAGSTLAESGVLNAILPLFLLAIFTKSAQFPFHFWLPGAMVAPTPVSTYLHAATMVKAGIFLLARTSPLFEGSAWRLAVILTGLATAGIGAALALKQDDLKALLAYSTVSQLGFLVALVGVGTFAALSAAALHIVAHSLYKSTLFMSVGIIERTTGTRSLAKLGGLRTALPGTAAVVAVAAISMAGIPPLLGFVSKEAAFDALLEAPGTGWWSASITALAVGAMIMTFAYSALIYWGPFEGSRSGTLQLPDRLMLAPVAVTGTAGLLTGLVVPAFDGIASSTAAGVLGRTDEVHFSLWHGFSPALALSLLVITAGATLFWIGDRVRGWLGPVRDGSLGVAAFDRLETSLLGLGARVARVFSSQRPVRHFVWVLGVTGAAGAAAGAYADVGALSPAPLGRPMDWAVISLLVLTCVGVARATNRLAAGALVGIAGFLVAMLYVLLGAPDLVLTQLLVETLTVTMLVFVFRKLPRSFSIVSSVRRRGAFLGAVVGGLLAAAGTYLLSGRRPPSDSSRFYADAAYPEAGGTNVVNTILVDFRALDTLGEITVLGMAAIGVYSLLRTRGGGQHE